MEVVYILITVFEIILVFCLAKILFKAKIAVDNILPETKKIVPLFKIVKNVLNLTSSISKTAKKTLKFQKFLAPIKKTFSLFSALHLIKKHLLKNVTLRFK